jgi:UDP-N-acetylmuramoyl-L-alanyl-D-glutamate--2,6-diaminopimelate ligase
MEAYRDAKARLFEMVAWAAPKPFARRAAVLNAADPASDFMASRCPGVPVYRYALDPAAPFHAGDVQAGPDGTAFELVTPGGRARCRLRLLGLHNVENALAAAAVAASQGVGVASIAEALSSFESVPGRLEPIDEGQPFRVFVDIASTPEAFRKVLELLRPATGGELIVVFGAAGERDRNRRFGMGAVAAALADFAVLTNEDPRSEDPEAIIDDIARSMIDAGAAEGERFVRVTDRREAIAFACARARPGDTVLLAGKGTEQAIDLRDGSIPWDERAVARDALRGLRTPAGQ